MASYGFIFDFFIGIIQPAFPLFNAAFAPFFSMFDFVTASQVTVGVLSTLIAALISVLYYLLIDQEKYNQIKEKQSKLQNKVKEARENDEMEKANKYVQESMSMQKKFMKASIKPIFGSMFVFFIMVPWIIFTFSPIVELPQQNTGYSGDLKPFDGSDYTMEGLQVEQRNDTNVLIYNGNELKQGDQLQVDGATWQVRNVDVPDNADHAEVKLSFSFLKLPFSLPLIGGYLEWLGFYILFQIPGTIIFRKLLGVH